MKQEKLIKLFLNKKYPACTVELELNSCFDYYGGLCYSLKTHIKKKTTFLLLSNNEKNKIENYIKLNKHNKNGKQMAEYYNVLNNVIELLKEYLPFNEASEEADIITPIKIIGLSLNIPNDLDIYLYKLFKNINICNSIWEISNIEAYKSNSNDLNINGKMNKRVFDELTSKFNYYLISVVIKIYIDRKCILTCNIEDCTNIKIFCNDEDIIECIYKNALLEEFTNLKYIT